MSVSQKTQNGLHGRHFDEFDHVALDMGDIAVEAWRNSGKFKRVEKRKTIDYRRPDGSPVHSYKIMGWYK
jgi:hypothetical protein